MKITPKRVVKAVLPYGALLVYRRTRTRTDRKRYEHAEQQTLSNRVNDLLVGAKTLKNSAEPKTVVSLTSYGARLSRTAPLAIASLLRQDVMPDAIILWLARGEKVPKLLKDLTKYGLQIRYCEDLKSYKKLIPALKRYPNSVIITADDDVIYPKNWLSQTLRVHKREPAAILVHRARQIALNGNKTLKRYWDWPLMGKNIKNSHLIMPNGVGGVLYPPHVLSDEVFDRALYMELAPHGDDLWFWAMAELNGTKRVFVEGGFSDTTSYILDDKGLWNTVNKEDNNDVQFSKILERFPELQKNVGANLPQNEFPGSKAYWEGRYAVGGNSGAGSYDNLAEFKAEIINDFVEKNSIKTVMEFGVGDGNQLRLANYPHFVGFDVSETAIRLCQELFKGDPTKEFYTLDKSKNQKADLTMSLDVLYHLVEKDVFEEHIKSLFKAAQKFVIIYAYDGGGIQTAVHVKSRKFTSYIKRNISDWELVEHIPNKYPYDESDPQHTTWADFYIYRHKA